MMYKIRKAVIMIIRDVITAYAAAHEAAHEAAYEADLCCRMTTQSAEAW